MKKNLIVLFVLLSLVLVAVVPSMGFAQGTNVQGFCDTNRDQATLQGAICKIGDVLNALVPILIVLALLYFIWGVIKYVISGDEEAKAKGRNMIIYGLIGLTIIVGVWGLVNFLLDTFGVEENTPVFIPQVPR